MNNLHLLKPDDAAKRSAQKVKDWKAEQERRAANAKRIPAARNPAVEGPNANPLPIGMFQLQSMLLRAAEFGDEKEVERLLNSGRWFIIDATDRFDDTALMKAASRGFKRIVEMLIAKGANVNYRGRVFRISVLEKAMQMGNWDVVEVLKAHGAKE